MLFPQRRTGTCLMWFWIGKKGDVPMLLEHGTPNDPSRFRWNGYSESVFPLRNPQSRGLPHLANVRTLPLTDAVIA